MYNVVLVHKIFERTEPMEETILLVCRLIFPILTALLLYRCVRSMFRDKYDDEVWAYLEDDFGERLEIRHWESVVGRAKSSDIIINDKFVSRVHSAIMRDDKGAWKIADLHSAGGTYINEEEVLDTVDLHDGDILSFSRVILKFHDLSEIELAKLKNERPHETKAVSPALSLLILSIMQAILALEFTITAAIADIYMICLGFFSVFVAQWFCFIVMKSVRRNGFEPEILAFFLSTLGVAIVASSTPDEMLKQIILLLVGIAAFFILGFILRDLTRVKKLRNLAIFTAFVLLVLNIFFGSELFGATNWISIAGISLQPSELIKVLFIFTGAVALERMFKYSNIFGFIIFSAICVITMAIIGDFGTALVFFATFIIISFMRSGSIATVLLAISSAGLAGFLVVSVKPYIAERFSTWGNAWSDIYGSGYQQTRALSAAASGGLIGKGANEGWLKDIFAANTDMVFAMLSEELGLIVAIAAVLALVALTLFAVRNAAHGRSTYYVIAGCAAASLMLVQMSLNVFGSLDLLPFTGVTFPFVSKGGTSLLSCWMLLAFIKAADTRPDSSFVVKLSASRKVSKGLENS